MNKWLSLAMIGMALTAGNSYASIDHRIAQGLPPLSQQQSIQTLQPFQGNFRILGTKIYQDDEQAKFSPIDYAVSWGLFADPKIAKNIAVRQYDRYLNWTIKQLPVPAEQAMQMVSNMHMIPANPHIAKQLKQAKRGDLIHLKGELVEVRDKDMVWRSSLSTTDVGDGACEVFRVSELVWLEQTKS